MWGKGGEEQEAGRYWGEGYLEEVAGTLMDMVRRALVTWRSWARKDWPGGTRELDRPLSRDSIAIFWKFKLCVLYNMTKEHFRT